MVAKSELKTGLLRATASIVLAICLLAPPMVSSAETDERFIYLSAIRGVSGGKDQWLFFQIDKKLGFVFQNYWPYKSEEMLRNCGRKPTSASDFVYDYMNTRLFQLITTEDRYMWRSNPDPDLFFYDAINRKNLIYEAGMIRPEPFSQGFQLIREKALVKVLSKSEFLEHKSNAEAVCRLARSFDEEKENQI